jgi:hypothetical protein
MVRNSRGNWLLGFSGFIGTASSLLVELHAILNGLILAKNEVSIMSSLNLTLPQLLVSILQRFNFITHMLP